MAIPAHFERAQSTRQQREPRRTLLFDAQGTTASGGPAGVLVHNISANGLLLECSAKLKSGEAIEIDLPEAGPTPARVMWASGQLYGCAFEQPITSAALSAAQLRSVVEGGVSVGAPGGEGLAARIQRLRKARGLTLAEVAAELEVSKPTVWAWEKGRARPLDDRIEALAQVLGVPKSELEATGPGPALQELLENSRSEIARACGTSPDKVRIFVEL